VHLDAAADPQELEELHTKVVERAPIPNTVARPVEVNARLT
jgi:hypothetical protein